MQTKHRGTSYPKVEQICFFLHIFYSEFFVYAFVNDFSIFFNTCIGNTLYFSLRKHMGIMDITRIATTSYS